MANTILTIDMITRKALEILENNLVITRNVNRQYDNSYAVEGAKIGTTPRRRRILPAKPPTRNFRPRRSSTVLISLRNQPPIWQAVPPKVKDRTPSGR